MVTQHIAGGLSMRGSSTVLALTCAVLAACNNDGVSVDANEDNFCDEIAEVAPIRSGSGDDFPRLPGWRSSGVRLVLWRSSATAPSWVWFRMKRPTRPTHLRS